MTVLFFCLPQTTSMFLENRYRHFYTIVDLKRGGELRRDDLSCFRTKMHRPYLS